MSTRPAGCSTDAARVAQGVEASERIDGRWNASPFDSLMESLDPTRPIVVYVHGNQITASAARQRGLDVYRHLVGCAEDERPIQFVIFSWCSDKVPGLLRDYREKAARTRPVAWQLAWVFDHLPYGSHVGLLGYSYGARVSSGAAHLMAGGSLSGLRYATDCSDCRVKSVRAVFLAAAYDACWNSPRSYHGMALERIDSLLTTINPRDPAMRFYKWVPTEANPPALGGDGPKGLTREQASRVRLLPVANTVGKSHNLYDYLAAPGVMRMAWRRLAFADESLEPQVAGEDTPAEDLAVVVGE
ncbi:hypothetical protein [Botrimarina colliarenosi]|uniref:hypothetical protein n=1 Tax=Botrimarina colliarenosi TaxID=2528001 RepID=UPI0011B64C49|nr:hypothetical protein [Botrimarina colliarenosi]